MADTELTIRSGERNPLENARLAFIGCGVMAEAIIAGLLRRQLVTPDQIVGSHPRVNRREELYTKYGTRMFENNREAVCMKCKVLRTAAESVYPSIDAARPS